MTKNNKVVLVGVVWLLLGLWMIGQSGDLMPGVTWIALGVVLIIVYTIRGRAHPAP